MALLLAIYSILTPAYAEQTADGKGQIAADSDFCDKDNAIEKNNEDTYLSSGKDGPDEEDRDENQATAKSDSLDEEDRDENQAIAKTDSLDKENSTTENQTLSDQDLSSEGYADKQAAPLYEDGCILIYSYQQLLLIGSNQPVYAGDSQDTGEEKGDILYDEAGEILRYRSDRDYRLAKNIELPANSIWQPADQFTGRFVPAESSFDKPLYDKDSDTIYLYHIKQLIALSDDEAAKYPVMSGDAESASLGMGQLIYPDDGKAGNHYLTYSKAHHYVLSSFFSFTNDEPEPKANGLKAKAPSRSPGDDRKAGRDFEGQVIKKIDGEPYILIGNQDQLRAIGSDLPVYTRVYQTESAAIGSGVSRDDDGNEIMLYGGDADLSLSQNGYVESEFGLVPQEAAWKARRGVDQETGEVFRVYRANSWDTGLTYSSKANYIIFRNIDLEDSPWTPLMFNGTMTGAIAKDKEEKLWDGDAIGNAKKITARGEDHRPVISNIKIEKSDRLNVNEYIGVGFFATISNQINEADIGISGGRAKVSNLALSHVEVKNLTSTAGVNTSLINEVTRGLDLLVGGLLDLVVGLLSFGQVNAGIADTLTNILNARARDPDIFATGAFAGRIIGDVLVEDCLVTDHVTVTNINDSTGGFVGYTEGMTLYSGLSESLGLVARGLAAILNLIPAVGLGDLISILLENALPLGKLIVTGYINPVIKNCGVENLQGNIGSGDKDFAGGFVGQQIGTQIKDSYVKNSSYSVQAKNYTGGFGGVSREAEIKGLLDGLGIDLVGLAVRIAQGTSPSESELDEAANDTDTERLSVTLAKTHPQSFLKKCTVSDSIVDVTGENFLGGFLGGLSSSYLLNCELSNQDELSIEGGGDCAGGFVGCAQAGWSVSLGASPIQEKSLLGLVRQLAAGLLSTEPELGKQLLTITGASPSAILGCQMECGSVKVSASGSYAGGLVGKGNGLFLGSDSDAMFDRLEDRRVRELLYDGNEAISNRKTSLVGLEKVRAGKDCAGGVAGSMGTAAFSGVLNDVIGLGNFIRFVAEDITLTGVSKGYEVTAGGDNAGGGMGSAVGGQISKVSLFDIGKVEADNRAGGFAGSTGPGDLLGSGGLTLNILGLNNVLELSDLLSIGQAVSLEISDTSVTAVPAGLYVEALGNKTTSTEITAAGFIAKSHSSHIIRSHVYRLKSVKAPARNGYAGGFLATSAVGGLADVADENAIKGLLGNDPLIGINSLVTAVGYIIPSYTDCSVHYLDGGFVDADLAGGFVADMQAGTVDNETHTTSGNPDYTCVYNISRVKGRSYGGGFGGRVVSGGLAEAGKGISILGNTAIKLSVNGLLDLMDVYVPKVNYAGVYSPAGFVVEAKEARTGPAEGFSGCAGGFIGYASGAQISHSNVNKLKRSDVTAPDDLEAVDAPSYFDHSSSYAVTGGRYAGGYVGRMDIGSAASVGRGLSALDLLNVSNVVTVLSLVVSTIEHSFVYGCPGGFAILSSADGGDSEGKAGRSGGFAGSIEGGHIQDCHAVNFSYVIGQVSAGGYVGSIQPGSVANLLGHVEVDADGGYTDESNILSRLLDAADLSDSLLSLIQSFVPTIRNSTTSCIPCGGIVRAHAASDKKIQRGMAGGYVGHNEGGQIWGNNSNSWLSENDGRGNYTGDRSLCKVDRIRSVYGYEYAGGFTGYMECASTARTGNISLLGGLIQADSVLDALKAVYPTQENTAVYGPPRHLDMDTWNSWITYVGKYGGYGQELAATGKVSSAEELESKLSRYIYGYHVVAGRKEHSNTLISEGGDAGGYVGLMRSGVITNGQAMDAKKVVAMRSSGGFAGRMLTGGAAEFGGARILSYELNIGKLLQLIKVFVPTIKSSSVKGYGGGLTVIGKGSGQTDDITYGCGYAGGYAGSGYGGQIWGDETVGNPAAAGCNVSNLRRVQASNAAGGYVGLATAASVLSLDTNASQDLLQNLLNSLVTNRSELLHILDATISTIRGSQVAATDPTWGFVVEGVEADKHPLYAGGFAGSLEAAVLGNKDHESDLTVTDLRRVDGDLYAGGFFGLCDVSSLASISPEGDTTLLSLVQAGNVSLLDIFRTYIYHSQVAGVGDGFIVEAHRSDSTGILSETRYAGCAGGYGGGLMNGHVENSHVTNFNLVKGLNYVGGFIGHMGKNGLADIDSASLSQPLADLLSTMAGLADVFGSHANTCSVTGIDEGFIVEAAGGEEEIAGGFGGFVDLSRIKDCQVNKLKQVYSQEITGGFAGKTSMRHLVELEADSAIIRSLAAVINGLLQLVSIDSLENLLDSSLLNISLPGGFTLADLGLLKKGNLLSLTLLGIPITVSLATDGHTAYVTLGDSRIEIADPNHPDVDQADLGIELLKANATRIERSKVTGIGVGYDVYGGGASNHWDGTGSKGYAGGFVGLNNEGRIIRNEMVYCDVIRGAPGLTGPFSGKSLKNDQNPTYSELISLEGFADDGYNIYHVYRKADENLINLLSDENEKINAGNMRRENIPAAAANLIYNCYDINHLDEGGVIKEYKDWDKAVMAADLTGTGSVLVDVYVTDAKAVLMDDSPTTYNGQSLVPESAQIQDPCRMDIDLTIQKLWKDQNDIDHIRPDHIKVRILRAARDVTYPNVEDPGLDEGQPDNQESSGEAGDYSPLTEILDVKTDREGWFTISKAEHGETYSASWTRVIPNLPAAHRISNDDGSETITYYTYKVEEQAVANYDTAISYDFRGYTATITNTHMPLLPMTGGKSDWVYVLGGLMLILLGLLEWKRRTH